MSLSQHVSKVVEASGRKSLLSFIFSMEGLKMFADGNVGFNKLFKGPTAGTLVGTDSFGNRYYENNTLAYGRKRWVVYKDTFNYNPTTVSPEWHGWLNYINDNTPHNYAFSKPIYQVPAYLTKTGTVDAYQPKGAWWNPQKRNWKKVETWQPPAKSS